MNTQSGKILCVEVGDAVHANQCEVLTLAGYTAVAASPQLAIVLLSHRKFDVIVAAGLTEVEIDGLVHVAGGAEILPLSARTPGTVMLFWSTNTWRNSDKRLGEAQPSERQREARLRTADFCKAP